MVLGKEITCIICCREVSQTTFGGNAARKPSVRDLLDLLGISFASFQSTLTISMDDRLADLGFCIICEALVTYGLDLKKKLRVVKSDLIRNSVRSNWELNGNAYDDTVASLDEKEQLRIRVWRLFNQCFSRCQVRLAVADLNKESLPAPIRTVKLEELPVMTILTEIEGPSSPASCNSLGANSSEGIDDDPLECDPLSFGMNEEDDYLPDVAKSSMEYENIEQLRKDTGCNTRDKSKRRSGLEVMPVNIEDSPKGTAASSEAGKMSKTRKTANVTECTLRREDSQEPNRHSPEPKRRRCTLNVKYKTEPLIQVIENDDKEECDDASWTADNDMSLEGDDDDEYVLQKSKSSKIHRDEASSKQTKSEAGTSKKKMSRIDLGEERDGNQIEGFKCEACSMICFSAEILALHIEEVHTESSCEQQAFECPTCHLELTSENYLSKEKFVEAQRYSWEIPSMQRVVYFKYFYELCEYHSVKCLRSTQLQLQGYVQNGNSCTEDGTSSKAQSQTLSQVNIDGDYHYYTPCVLCSSVTPYCHIKLHYNVTHRLIWVSDERFACEHCKELYVPKSSETEIGKLIPSDLDHFKEFVSLHSKCRLTSHSTKQFECEECRVEFESPEKFFTHNSNKHHKGDKYECDICAYRSSSVTMLNRHAKKAHKTTIRIHCARCLESFTGAYEYKEHLIKHFGKLETSSAGISAGSWKAHETRRKGKRYVPEACEICGNVYSRLSVHINKVHGYKFGMAAVKVGDTSAQDVTKNVIMPQSECFLCGKIFSSGQVADLHLQEEHDPPEEGKFFNFECFGCKKTFNQADYAIPDADGTFAYPPCKDGAHSLEFTAFWEFCDNHVRICTAKNAHLSKNTTRLYSQSKREGIRGMRGVTRTYTCSKCGEVFSNDRSFVLHLRVHYAHLLRKCLLCPFADKDPRKMRYHLKFAHFVCAVDNEYYSCVRCCTLFESGRPELFPGEINPAEDMEKFKEFVASHKDCPLERPALLSCPFCPKGFKTQYEVIKHFVRVHRKLRGQTKCILCNLEFASENDYKDHLPKCKNSRSRVYKCNLCPFETTRPYAIKDHERMHDDKRAFMCEVCGKGFNTESHLKRHKDIHEESGGILCPLCGKMFQHKHNLTNHIYCFHEKKRRPRQPKATQPEESSAESDEADSDFRYRN